MMIPSLFLTQNFEIDGLRIIDDMIYPVKWTAKIDMVVDPEAEGVEDESMQAGFLKITAWVNEVLLDSIFVDINSDLCEILNSTSGNNVVTLPGEPNDDVIAMVLLQKTRALVSDSGLFVLGVSLSASDTNVSYNVQGEDVKDLLPDISYNGSKKKSPAWWDRVDMSTSDIEDPENSGITFIADFEVKTETKKDSKTLGTVIEPDWEKK